jgi:hypothetical protein
MTTLDVMRNARDHVGGVRLNRQNGEAPHYDLFDALTIAGTLQPNEVIGAFRFLRAATGKENLIQFNAGASHREMRDALDKAIELAAGSQ